MFSIVLGEVKIVERAVILFLICMGVQRMRTLAVATLPSGRKMSVHQDELTKYIICAAPCSIVLLALRLNAVVGATQENKTLQL